MKICEKCNHKYPEDNILFCVFDGQELTSVETETKSNLRKITDKSVLQKIYTDFLETEGFKPQLTEAGNIVFKREGTTFIVSIDIKDTGFFSTAFPAFWEVESPSERIRALEVINKVNTRIKCANLNIVEDNVWANVEMFISSPEHFQSVFYRVLDSLKAIVTEFAKTMKEENSEFPSVINY